MTAVNRASLPRVLFFNINGNGMGHLSRCLAYAGRMRGRAVPVFFSLASAIEQINGFGFEADYFVSKFWSRSHINAWNRELARRFGMMLEAVRPEVVVFDGTWPFHGFMDACDAYGIGRRVWSNRGLHKPDAERVPVPESSFDLVLVPGELGAGFRVEQPGPAGRKVSLPPVTILDEDELLSRDSARAELGLDTSGRYVLFSLGPGNLKDVGDIGRALVDDFGRRGFRAAWARAPISARDQEPAGDVIGIARFPLARYMRAFDLFVGAAGYNTCCEVIQSGVPSLLVPNREVADDQAQRAEIVAAHTAAVVSACETAEEREDAVARLLSGRFMATTPRRRIDLDGARYAADEILALFEVSAP